MKRTTLLASMMIFLFIAGCSDEESMDVEQNQELSKAVSDYLLLKFGGQNNANLESSISSPANSSFSGMLNNFRFRGGRLDSTDADTVQYDDPWEWKTCATVTTTDNVDGSVTEVHDFGDGCFEGYEDYQYFVHGKYTSTFKHNYEQDESIYMDDYYYDMVYDNYGGTYYDSFYEGGESNWKMDGYSEYSGSSTYDESTGVFTGFYEYDSEFIYEWDSSSYYSKSVGASTYDEDKFIIEGENEYRSIGDPYLGEDYYYKSDILIPLVYDYSCYQQFYNAEDAALSSSYWFMTYVSGREAIDFRENDSAGSFIIDYGDGACDNLVTIIENGSEYEVDLGEFYEHAYQEYEGD